MSNLKYILGPMRVPFLLLPPACVLLGLGTAVWTTGQVNWFYFVLALVGGVAAHISVNALNEYFDFKSGLDSKTQRTPFSGGSGTLQADPARASWALITGAVACLVVAAIGVYFLFVRGWGILPLGLAGILVIVTYTTLITRQPLLCLIAPGVGFGTLMVMGTNFVLTGQYSWTAFVASLVPFFLVNNLLLLNQFPDAEADRTVGRRHLLIVAGKPVGAAVYGAFLALTYVSIGAGIVSGYLPVAAWLGLLTLVLAVPLFVGALKYAENLGKLMPYLGMNVLVNLATPTLLAVGLFVGK